MGWSNAGVYPPIPAQTLPPTPTPLSPPRQFFDVDEVYEALPKIKNDLLLVGGEDDVMIPSQGLRVIARRTTTPWLVVLREAGNAAWIQYLPSFVNMLDFFLDAYPDM